MYFSMVRDFSPSTDKEAKVESRARPRSSSMRAVRLQQHNPSLQRLLRTVVTMSASSTKHQLVLDPFVFKQFDDAQYTGTKIDMDKPAFEAKINELYESGAHPLVDGYAPFCKHVFVPNFLGDGIKVPYLEITPENEGKMRSGYDARREEELAVLVRWFPAETAPEPEAATFLDIILYSREQIRKEAAAMGREDEPTDAPWGIISVKAQSVDYELPMQPITMMRNALGADEGGSGVGLKRDEYTKSVTFWSKYAPIK